MQKKIFGIIGYPLSHSFSKKYFEKKFADEKLNYKYLNFEIKNIDEIKSLLKKHPDIQGLNVTIPYKQQVIKYITGIDKEAYTIGAINTIKIDKIKNKTLLTGYNTDIKGFEITLEPKLKKHHQKALILGTGGASKAIKYVLQKFGFTITEVSRNPLTKNQLSYEMVDKQIIEENQIIVNTTPLGMYPNINECPNIPYEYINSEHVLFDLIYNPEETQFLKKGKILGACTINGLKMFYAQAELSWEIWNT